MTHPRRDPDAARSRTTTAHVHCPRCNAPIQITGIVISLRMDDEQPAHRPARVRAGESLEETSEEFKRELVVDALRRAGGVRKRAAEIAGMNYSTFYKLVRRLGIDDDEIFD